MNSRSIHMPIVDSEWPFLPVGEISRYFVYQILRLCFRRFSPVTAKSSMWLPYRQWQSSMHQLHDTKTVTWTTFYQSVHSDLRYFSRYGISNHPLIDSLLNSLFMFTTEKISKLHITDPLWGDSISYHNVFCEFSYSYSTFVNVVLYVALYYIGQRNNSIPCCTVLQFRNKFHSN